MKKFSLKVYENGIFSSKLPADISSFLKIENLNGDYAILPGLVDVHVHLREPGFSYKEDIATGTLAGAKGGFTDVLSMPNLNPVPDSVENIKVQLSAIKEKAVINVYPYASITEKEKGEKLVDFNSLAPYCIAFSDDGKGVQNDEMMESAMLKAKALNKIICAHCEDETLLFGGYIHKGEYAKKHGHKGICSESEYKQVERDLKLVEKTGCAYHVCHISTKETVDLIRKAKKKGLNVTCETAPHYLVFNDNDLIEDGSYKMNPPIRSEEDRLALIEGIKDGTIDMIATDHAPHSIEEKSRGLKDSNFGIVGLETSFAVCYTYLVKTGIITFEKLVELMSINPSKRFKIKQSADKFTVFDLSNKFIIDSVAFASKGKSTPFNGKKVYGKCILTVLDGKVVYKD